MFGFLNPLRTRYRVKKVFDGYKVEYSGLTTGYSWARQATTATLDEAKQVIAQMKNPVSDIVHKE